MKTIDFELSKKLNDLWLLDNIDTEYVYHKIIKWIDEWKYVIIINHELEWKTKTDIKTLTIEEAIEFLPRTISVDKDYFWKAPIGRIHILWHKDTKEWSVWYTIIESQLLVLENWDVVDIEWQTLLEAIENLLYFLLENWLLNKN